MSWSPGRVPTISARAKQKAAKLLADQDYVRWLARQIRDEATFEQILATEPDLFVREALRALLTPMLRFPVTPRENQTN